MARERGNPQVARTFRRVGGFAEKKTDLWHAIRALRAARGQPDPAAEAEAGGHPDYLWLVPPFGGFIEVKDGGERLAFDAITPRQREWLDAWSDVSWLWLFMGQGRAGSAGRAAYLIPWDVWAGIETRAAEHGLRGIAWREPHQKALRAAGLHVAGLCAAFALTWAGGGAWDIPHPAHPFWTQPLRQVSFFAPSRGRYLNTEACVEATAHDRLPLF